MTKPIILIVEDEADIRRFVRMALEKEGMTVFEAPTAEQGRIDAATRKPNLAIIDLGPVSYTHLDVYKRQDTKYS